MFYNVIKKEKNPMKFKNSKLFNLCKDNKFVLLSFFTSIAIFVLIMFCYKMIPFGDITILRMDLYHQYGPLFAEYYDRLVGSGGLIYSWQSGGGGSFLGNFFNYLSSPLSLLIVFFGHKNTPEAIAFLIMLKGALSSGTFTYYLKASDEFKKHNALSAGFGLLYAYSGYFVAYYWNLMWLDGMVLLPLIVLGIERIINGKSAKLYVASLTILMISSYYMAYMVCIFATLYALCYYFGKYSFGTKIKDVAPSEDKFTQIKNNLKTALLPRAAGKFILFSILSGGLAAVALLPTVYALSSCSATSGTFPTELSTYYKIFDFLANHLASLKPTIRSSGDDVLPNIFCGIGTVMLAILYLYTKSISLKEKLSKAVLLVLLYLSFNLNYLNYIWHGFHFPNDLPYRFSYAYSFVLLIVAFKALMKIREITGREILNIGIGVSIFIVLVQEIESKNVNENTIVISLVFAVIYTIVLYLLNNKKFQTSAVASLLFCCMFAEVAIADTNNFDIDQPKTSYTADYKNFRALKEKLDSVERTTHYRMELTDLRTRMDPCWYNYNGVSTFSSMAYEKAANLHYNLGMFGNYINSYTYNPQTPVYNAMFSLKYLVDNSNKITLNKNLYKATYKADKFTAYENLYYLPIAYCVNSDIEFWDASTSGNPFELQSNYFESATGVKDVFDDVPITDVVYSNLLDFGADYDTGLYNYFKEVDGEPASFTMTITPKKTENIYIYLKSDNVDEITVRNEAGDFTVTQNTDEEYVLDIGEHEAGEILYIDVPIESGDVGYVDVYLAGLNETNFKKGYEILNDNGAMEVASFTDTKINGTVTADEECILYTSINYDDSWTVFVDGKEAGINDIVKVGGALLAVKLAPGTHDITFKYNARGLVPGAIISVVSLLILVFIFVVMPKMSTKVKTKEEVVTDETTITENEETVSVEVKTE